MVVFAGNVHSIETTPKSANITLWKLTRKLRAAAKSMTPGRLARLGDESFDLLTKLERGSTQQSVVLSGLECPDCGANMSLKNGKFGLFYGCDTYKETLCRGSVSADKHGEPLGQPVNAATRRARYVLRMAAREVYDEEGLILEDLRTYNLENCQELLDRLIKQYPKLKKFVEQLPLHYQLTRWERLAAEQDPLDTALSPGVKRA